MLVRRLTCLIFSFVLGMLAVQLYRTEQVPLGEPSEPVSENHVYDLPSRPARASHPTLITAGESVGNLFLGDDFERAKEVYGEIESDYDYGRIGGGPIPTQLGCGNYRGIHFWNSKDKKDPLYFDYGGAWVYLREGKVFQIKIQSPNFATAERITVGSAPAEVKYSYPTSEAWVKLNSSCNCTGGDNLLYWIDRSKGIAFEFHYHQKLKKKYLAYVFVFEPNTDFLPDGCVYLETQGWEKLPPFTLTEPRHMQDDFVRTYQLKHPKNQESNNPE